MLRTIFVFTIILVGATYSLRGAFYALLFYLWNAYFRPEQWTYGSLVYSLQLSFVIGLYLVVATLASVPRVKFTWRIGLMVAFLAQTLLSTILSEHTDASWPYLFVFFKVILVSFFITVLVTDLKRFRLTFIVIALSLGFECAKQGWAQLLLNPGGMNNNNIAFLGDNNGVAMGTMMLVPLFGPLVQTAPRRLEANMFRFLALGVFMRGFTTYSRGGFLAASVLGLITLLRSEKKLKALIAVGIVVGVVLSVMPPAFWQRMESINAPTEEQDESSRGRIHFWGVAVDMARAKPLTGVGLNGFSDSYEAYNDSEEFAGRRATHSIWFGTLADLGYPGLALFVLNWGLSIFSCWRISRAGKRDPAKREYRLYANALMSSLFVFGTAGTFLSAQYSEMFWHLVALSVALEGIVRAEAAAPAAIPVTVRAVPRNAFGRPATV